MSVATGADVNAFDVSGNTVLMRCAEKRAPLEMVQLLLSNDVDKDCVNLKVLRYACSHNAISSRYPETKICAPDSVLVG